MKRISNFSGIGILLFLFSQGIVSGQSKNDKIVVATVGKQKITYGQLKEYYRSGANEQPTLDELESFLPLYMDYVAKLQSARDLGYFEDSDLQAEYQVYAKQAAYSYWLENEIKPTEFEKFYRKAGFEVKSEHVLIALPENAQPMDTLEAYNQIMEARTKFLNGEADMAVLNREYSSTNQGRPMGGDLPWFGAGATVTEFEDVVFDLDVGEISMPVRSQFGYHIIHLSDKRKSQPARNVSHIYVQTLPQKDKIKIDEAYDALKQGMPWELAVEMYSEDGPTINSKGNIGWVRYGTNFNPDFVEYVMKANPELEYNEPVRTPYGYHIFKIDSVESYKNEADRRKTLMESFLDSPNFKKSNTFILDWIRKNTDYQLNEAIPEKYTAYLSEFDSIAIENIPAPDFSKETLVTFLNFSKTVGDFDHYVKELYGKIQAQSPGYDWVWDFTDKFLDEHIIDLVVYTYPNFAEQLENYRTGLAVFKINDEKAWSGATVDSTALRKIYDTYPDKYSYGDRKFYYLLSSSDSTLHDGVDFIKSGNNPDSVRVHYPKITVVRDSTGLGNEDYQQFLDQTAVGMFSEEFKYNKRNAFIYLKDILPARRMTFDESFQRLLSEYQPVREQKWLNSLRKKYKMKPNVKNLRKAYNNERNL